MEASRKQCVLRWILRTVNERTIYRPENQFQVLMETAEAWSTSSNRPLLRPKQQGEAAA